MIRLSSCLFIILMSCRLCSAQDLVAGTETIVLSPDKNTAVKLYQKSDARGKRVFTTRLALKTKQ